MFVLDERLKNDTVEVCDWPLCKVLLMNDANYPWVILVPRKEGSIELFDLNETEQQQLTQESMRLAAIMKAEFVADKMNVANLGNMVSQLHIHHIARYKSDVAWPKPVWGAMPAKPYTPIELTALVSRLQAILVAV
jgi:diadenosine tetraphosphate (Ap4A) HIT family hydrolase